MEKKIREIGKEELEQVVGGGVDPSFFVRPRTKEGQKEFVRENFEIEKSMGLSYQYACHLDKSPAPVQRFFGTRCGIDSKMQY